jgi:hypothetical protein
MVSSKEDDALTDYSAAQEGVSKYILCRLGETVSRFISPGELSGLSMEAIRTNLRKPAKPGIHPGR